MHDTNRTIKTQTSENIHFLEMIHWNNIVHCIMSYILWNI